MFIKAVLGFLFVRKINVAIFIVANAVAGFLLFVFPNFFFFFFFYCGEKKDSIEHVGLRHY